MLPNSLSQTGASAAEFDDLEPTASFDHPDKPEEACGVFGVYAPGEDVAKLTYFGLYALQHRGQESAGLPPFLKIILPVCTKQWV